MKYKKLILMLILIVSGMNSKVHGDSLTTGDFIIFPSYTGNFLYDEILKGSEAALIETCSAAGRLVPIEYNYKKAAIEKSDGTDRDNLYRNAALHLKADIYAVLTAYAENGDYVLKLNLYPLNKKYENLKFEKIIRSRIPENIPLKAAREFALLLNKLTLKCEVIKIYSDGSALINAGQWHGLEAGSYSTAAGNIKIENVTRYTAIAMGINFTEGETLEFKFLPELQKYIKKNDYAVNENTAKFYGTDEFFDKRDGSVKESIKGTCVINQGASFCLPGYGSFLSIEYMGIEKGKPDYAGVFITSSLTAVHLGLVPVLEDFDVNFFPWVDDSGRTDQMKRLNYFMWGTLPLTFTASFFSQLSYNYSELNMLPPQFADHDRSAAVISVFVPGGGMFYKGYRWTGWGVYIGEMSLAGCAVYSEDDDMRNIFLGSLAAVKCAEIIVSYFISPSYNYFNREVSSFDAVDFSIGMNRNHEGGGDFTASVSLRY
ncbi:MAG TPA: hypothetical protein PLY36_01930 [Spirochaetota bacterium]|nr:hypothetical protein [Spirochaetota bacterium]